MRRNSTKLAQSFLNTVLKVGVVRNTSNVVPSPLTLWGREIFNNNPFLPPYITNPVALYFIIDLKLAGELSGS